MKAMLLRDGDLVPSQRDFVMVRGAAKVAQDLRYALLEPLGNDRFHTGWGSTLADFIASISNEETRMEVEAEVNRVVANYAAVQRDKIEADIFGNTDTRYSTEEILSRIREVRVQTRDETVLVDIAIQTVAGDLVLIAEAVT